MGFDTRQAWFVSFTGAPPFGVAFVKRAFDGKVIVGGCFENDWSLKQPLEQLAPVIKKALGSLDHEDLFGVFQDSEDGAALRRVAVDIIPAGWFPVYAPIAAVRQSLGSLIAVQGPATSKFQIEATGPGAELLAQRIDAKQFEGVLDAVALCVNRIERDFPEGSNGRPEHYKIETNLNYRNEREHDPRGR